MMCSLTGDEERSATEHRDDVELPRTDSKADEIPVDASKKIPHQEDMAAEEMCSLLTTKIDGRGSELDESVEEMQTMRTSDVMDASEVTVSQPDTTIAIAEQDGEATREGKGESDEKMFQGCEMDPKTLRSQDRKEGDKAEQKIQVVVRIRPLLSEKQGEEASTSSDKACIHACSNNSLITIPPEESNAYKSGERSQTFNFTKVMDANTSQEHYFESTAAPLVQDWLANPKHSSIMMAYGLTAAGKTFTIEGNKNNPGVLPRALIAAFRGIEDSSRGNSNLLVSVSYCEIYNEMIHDLLDEKGGHTLSSKSSLKLVEDKERGVVVSGLSEVVVSSADEAMSVFNRGARNRQRAGTNLNDKSSRSHSIFTINLLESATHASNTELYFEQSQVDAVVKEVHAAETPKSASDRSNMRHLGRMAFVDLAGSERAQRTGNTGIRFRESIKINSSLMTLGRCIEALRWNQQHKIDGLTSRSQAKVIPYRESKITQLFRDVFLGYGHLILCVNVSPNSKDYDETAHVLRYALFASSINLQQCEAPRRAIKAITPSALRRAKRKAQAKECSKSKLNNKLEIKAHEQKRKRFDRDQAEKIVEKASSCMTTDKLEVDAPPSLKESISSETLETYLWNDQEPKSNQSFEKTEEGGGISTIETTPTNPQGANDTLEKENQSNIVSEEPWEDLRPVSIEKSKEIDEDVDEELISEIIGNGRRILADVQMREEFLDNTTDSQASLETKQKLDSNSLLPNGNFALLSPCTAQKQNLDCLFSAGCSPRTPNSVAREKEVGTENDEYHVTIEMLQNQVRELIEKLHQAEERSVILEGEVREEVGAEMDKMVAEIENTYKKRVMVLESRTNQLGKKLQTSELLAVKLQNEIENKNEEIISLQNLLQQSKSEVIESEEKLSQAKTEIAAAKAEAEMERAQAAAMAAALSQAHAQIEGIGFSNDQESEYQVFLEREITQMEANRGMLVDMAESQTERLRKENMALHQRLMAALAALESFSSPGKPIIDRIMSNCAGGDGCGAAGTPHEVALARARAAACASLRKAAKLKTEETFKSSLQHSEPTHKIDSSLHSESSNHLWSSSPDSIPDRLQTRLCGRNCTNSDTYGKHPRPRGTSRFAAEVAKQEELEFSTPVPLIDFDQELQDNSASMVERHDIINKNEKLASSLEPISEEQLSTGPKCKNVASPNSPLSNGQKFAERRSSDEAYKDEISMNRCHESFKSPAQELIEDCQANFSHGKIAAFSIPNASGDKIRKCSEIIQKKQYEIETNHHNKQCGNNRIKGEDVNQCESALVIQEVENNHRVREEHIPHNGAGGENLEWNFSGAILEHPSPSSPQTIEGKTVHGSRSDFSELKNTSETTKETKSKKRPSQAKKRSSGKGSKKERTSRKTEKTGNEHAKGTAIIDQDSKEIMMEEEHNEAFHLQQQKIAEDEGGGCISHDENQETEPRRLHIKRTPVRRNKRRNVRRIASNERKTNEEHRDPDALIETENSNSINNVSSKRFDEGPKSEIKAGPMTRRRRRLLTPAKPMSTAMQDALGEIVNGEVIFRKKSHKSETKRSLTAAMLMSPPATRSRGR